MLYAGYKTNPIRSVCAEGSLNAEIYELDSDWYSKDNVSGFLTAVNYRMNDILNCGISLYTCRTTAAF